MPDDLVVGGAAGSAFEPGLRAHVHIVQPPAPETPDVVMRCGLGIEAPRSPSRLDSAQEPVLGEDLQVPVDSAQADAREPAPHSPVDLVGGGMPLRLPQRIEKDAALAGHS